MKKLIVAVILLFQVMHSLFSMYDSTQNSLQSLPPELRDIVFQYIPGDDIGFNNIITMLPDGVTESIAHKIETAFFDRVHTTLQKINLTNNSSQNNQGNRNQLAMPLIKEADRHILDRVCWHMVNFARYNKTNNTKKKLASLFKDVRKLNKAIPHADTSWFDLRLCCSNRLQNTDALDKKKIKKALNYFCNNSDKLWYELHEETKNAFGYSDYMQLRKNILHYFNLRLDDYCDNAGRNFTLPLTSFSSGVVTVIGGGLCKSALLISSGFVCTMVSVGLLVCLSNPEEDNIEQTQCSHHDFSKIHFAKSKLIKKYKNLLPH